MNKIITFILLFTCTALFSQGYQDFAVYRIDFEDTTQNFRIEIDKISNPYNIWQIGNPLKTVFSSAFSPPNVMITDTSDVYPTNDTSSFIIRHRVNFSTGFNSGGDVSIYGRYQVNSDSLADYGMLEFSPDNGFTWVNLLTDTFYYKQWAYEWLLEKPVFTGNSQGWVPFCATVKGFSQFFRLSPGDTVLYRFSFISDSLQTNKDGLMFDDLQFFDVGEGIDEHKGQFHSKVFPNPGADHISIEFDNNKKEDFSLTISNIQGQTILHKEISRNGIIQLDMESYKPGVYLYKLLNLNSMQNSWGKIIKK
jgi:hypothetical protein